ncbi:GNAT family N-acetyltransferase [Vallitalea guaymasensis]|uniref:GNAT family N-acetyltransferase n=1 Tax=Vallitalea guaymasensis TaxID=1185412 RepID=A0A8J8SAI2_9FIRM|nr:GNAT family N-acetyltransferase [Vallitalea guaymasensis]QUH27758.1 GNAT family N-acetyltransferase [Vallitalea guaymasensis]
MDLYNIVDNQQLDKFAELQSYCFGVDKELVKFELDNMFGKDDSIILGAFEDDLLQGALVINDFEIYWQGLEVKMGGIGGVATFPEARQNHAVEKLLIESLKMMNDNNQVFSMLAPFAYSFYRKYGWEYGSRNKKLKISINDLSHFQSGDFSVKPINKDHIQSIKKVYEHFYCNYNGATKRTDLRWELIFARNAKNDIHSYGVFDNEDKLRGYIFYKINSDGMIVQEIVYDSLEVRKQIMRFIFVHRAQFDKVTLKVPHDNNLDILLKNPRQHMEVSSGMMVRIINAKKILEMYPYKNINDLKFSISIEDKYAAWNNNTFQINIDDNNVEVKENEDIEPDISCSIQVLSQIVFGFLSWEEAMELDLITCKDQIMIGKLNNSMPKRCSYVTDPF